MHAEEIKISEIIFDENFNCRATINPADVIELAKDIELQGLLSPVLVYPFKGQYRLVAGFRRFKAHKLLKRETIPCRVLPVMTEQQAALVNLRENIHRTDLNMVEEANAIKVLLFKYNSLKEMAEAVGKPQHWVNVRVSLLKLPDDIQQEAIRGTLTQQDVLRIAKIKTPEKQYEFVRKIKTSITDGQKARVTKEIEKEINKKPRSVRTRNRQEMRDACDAIYDCLGPSIVTRILAWTTGEIPNEEMIESLITWAKDNPGPIHRPDKLQIKLEEITQ